MVCATVSNPKTVLSAHLSIEVGAQHHVQRLLLLDGVQQLLRRYHALRTKNTSAMSAPEPMARQIAQLDRLPNLVAV